MKLFKFWRAFFLFVLFLPPNLFPPKIRKARETATVVRSETDSIEDWGVGFLDAEEEVAEGTVDVFAAALHRRVVGRVDDVDGQVAAEGAIVACEQGVQVLVTRPKDVFAL